MQHSASTPIDRGADEVYRFLVDFRNDTAWRAVETSELVAGTVGEVGARYRQVMVHGGARSEATIETTVADPESREVGFVTVDDPTGTVRTHYTVRPDGPDRCHVVLRCSLEPRGWRKLVAFRLASRLPKHVRHYLGALSAALEGDPPA